METAERSEPQTSTNRRKRTAAQRAADGAFIESHVVRGKTQAAIAELLSEVRPYRVSRQQIAYDIEKLKERWRAAAKDTRMQAAEKALRKLDEVEKQAWAIFELALKGKGERDLASLQKILEVHDRRVRILGLEAPRRTELSGPDGGPLKTEYSGPITEAEEDAILQRHLDRMLEKRKLAVATRETEVATDQSPVAAQNLGS